MPPPRRFMNCVCSWTGWTPACSACCSLTVDPIHEPDCLFTSVSYSAGVHPLSPGSDNRATAPALVWPVTADRPLEALPRTEGLEPRDAPAPGTGKSGAGVHQVRADFVHPPRSVA